jgi:hypothetical protein
MEWTVVGNTLAFVHGKGSWYGILASKLPLSNTALITRYHVYLSKKDEQNMSY